MSKNNNSVFVTAKYGNKEIGDFTARIIGFIDNPEADALCNIEGAGKKLYHAESYEYDEANTDRSYNKRVVFATSDYKKNERVVIITPVVKFMTFTNQNNSKTFNCEGNRSYIIRKSLY